MKIDNKSIVFGLGILGIFTFAAIAMPAKASAYDELYGGGYFNRRAPHYNESYIPNDNSNDVVYVNGGNNENYSRSNSNTTYNNSKSTSTSNTTKNTTKSTSTSNQEDFESNDSEELSDIAGNAIFGTGGFAPSGLVQWILLGIFILLIVILVRKITGAEARYHAEPLKHA